MKTSLLATIVLLAANLPAQDPEFGTPVSTTLTTIRKDPEAFRNVKVRFTAQFASLGKLSNPFFTRFTPTDYSNLHVWADEQPIWQRDAYEDLFGNLFYPKTGKQLQEVFELRMYQRMEITAIVRNTFQNAPWIEIQDFAVVGDQVDAAVLAHMYRGEQFMAERRWQRAIAELTMAPGAGVPPEVQRAAYKNLGICYLRIGESNQAVGCLRTAAGLSTNFDHEIEHLLATAETRPSRELDRVVDHHGLKDFERPMWEAFDDGGQEPRRIRTMQ
ncbi:MAG: hypothetical protein AB7O97_03410 [Planctomycetota bacterium]